MSRFIEAPQEVLNELNEVVDEWFPNYKSCNIKVLMDSKRSKSKGRTVFASIKKANDKEKYFTSSNIYPDGADYLLFIDDNIFSNIGKEDRVRILRHELRHIYFDSEKDDPWKVIPHDFEDFVAEVELNKEDPNWSLRVLEIAESVYEK